MIKIKKLLIHSNLPRNSGLFRHPTPCLYLLYYEDNLYDFQQLEHSRFDFLGNWKTPSLFIPVFHKLHFSHHILLLCQDYIPDFQSEAIGFQILRRPQIHGEKKCQSTRSLSLMKLNIFLEINLSSGHSFYNLIGARKSCY